MSALGEESVQADVNPSPYAPPDVFTGRESGASQVGWNPTQVVLLVAKNVFKRTLQKNFYNPMHMCGY